MGNPDSTKSQRRAAAKAANVKGAYEETPYGRRRISKLPQALVRLIWYIGIPIAFIYRRLRRPRRG